MIPYRLPLRSALAGGLLLAASCAPDAPPPPDFHAERAWSYLGQQIAFGPRYPGDEGAERQTRWLLRELEHRADTVLEQRFTFEGEGGRRLEGTNVLARYRPEMAERVLLVAHRDTRRRADGSRDSLDRRFPVPGANVNASGVAVLMELAMLLGQQAPPVGVDLLFTDADEYAADRRTAGTRHFLESTPGYRARYAVVLQGVAGAAPAFALDSGSLAAAREPTMRLWDAAAGLGYDSLFVRDTASALEGQGGFLTAAGIPAVVVADRAYGVGNLYWQSVGDVTARVRSETLEAVGRAVTALVYAEPAPAGGS